MRAVRGIVWIAVALLALLAFVQTAWVPLLAVAVAVLLLPIAGWLAVSLAARKTVASVASATTAAKDAPVAIRLNVHNGARIPLAHVRATVRARNLLTGESASLAASASVPPHADVEMPIELTSAYCGRIACEVESVHLFEPFRIFSRRVQCFAERRFTVMPTLQDVLLRDVYAASPLSDTTVFSPYVRGNDLSEVFALREYEEGDELKRIHWKLSEKIDRMIVRDASLPLDNALLLIWDKGLAQNSQGGLSQEEKAARADSMAEVVLALMEQLAHADVAFEVASNDILSGSCPRAFVTDENDIYEVIGQLLSAPVASAQTSGLDEYVRFYGNLSCSRLIYVCSERPAGLEAVLGMREALLFVCDGGQDMAIGPQINEIHFSADGARIALEMAGAM